MRVDVAAGTKGTELECTAVENGGGIDGGVREGKGLRVEASLLLPKRSLETTLVRPYQPGGMATMATTEGSARAGKAGRGVVPGVRAPGEVGDLVARREGVLLAGYLLPLRERATDDQVAAVHDGILQRDAPQQQAMFVSPALGTMLARTHPLAA